MNLSFSYDLKDDGVEDASIHAKQLIQSSSPRHYDQQGMEKCMESSIGSATFLSSDDDDDDDDEDDNSLEDGMLASSSLMCHYAYDDETKDDRVIHYLGREYPAHLFHDNLTQCMQEFQSNASLKLIDGEQLATRWSKSTRSISFRRSSPPRSIGKGLPPKANSHGGTRNHHHHNIASSLESRSEDVITGTRTPPPESSLFHKLLGVLHTDNGDDDQKKKQDRWTTRLEQWGYTNHDVLDIVQDDQVWAKLQRDLRNRRAITNTLIEQRIHVFVHNTKRKKKQQQLQQPPQQRQQQQQQR
jgi:hypothetical protein